MEYQERTTPVWSRWIGRTVLALTAMMCLYLGATMWSARGDLLRAIDRLPFSSLPGVVGLVFLGLALRAARWHYYVRRLQWQIPVIPSICAFLASFAFTATPGKAGEVVKSVLLRTRYDVPLADGVGVLLVERLGDLLAVLILAAGGLALLADGLVYLLIAALLVVGTTVVVSSRRIYGPIVAMVARVPKLSGVADKVLRLLEAGHELLRPIPFLVGMGLALIAWSCEGWAFHLLIRGFGVEMSLLTACSIYGVATLVGALSMLPGGIGGFEAVMGFLLVKQFGMSLAEATLPVVLFRLCSLWLGSLLGLAFMLGWLLWSRRGSTEAAFVVVGQAVPDQCGRQAQPDLLQKRQPAAFPVLYDPQGLDNALTGDLK
jgi:glycosyltransferase 2 family protein